MYLELCFSDAHMIKFTFLAMETLKKKNFLLRAELSHSLTQYKRMPIWERNPHSYLIKSFTLCFDKTADFTVYKQSHKALLYKSWTMKEKVTWAMQYFESKNKRYFTCLAARHRQCEVKQVTEASYRRAVRAALVSPTKRATLITKSCHGRLYTS